MAVLQLESIQKAFGPRLILRDATLILEPGERVGLVGVNGSGKSTLLKISAGLEDADSGIVRRHPDVALLSQEPRIPGITVWDAIEDALKPHFQVLDDHRRCAEALSTAAPSARKALETELDALQSRIDYLGWEPELRARSMLTRVEAPLPTAKIASLSGGERRRVALACALTQSPALLLLDEPTNHLDADTISWLEGTLSNYPGALLLVTHDRYFLDNVSTRIVEIEDGETVSYDGNYSDYLIGKAERSLMLEKAETRRMRMITTEAEWAARKPGAQRKHDWARLDRLEKLKAQRPLWRAAPAEFTLGTADELGGTVIETRKLGARHGNRTLFSGLDLSINRGERLGIVGPNGAGKTTLLKLLCKESEPQIGEIVFGRRTKIAVFHQDRQELDPRLTVWEAVGQGNDVVTMGDKTVNLHGYLDRFLFPALMHTTRLRDLSGGERARVLLARLILQGANLLMLDEPTNDLDLMTLRVLEQALIDFNGSVLVVTHDRWFLDRVATGVLAFEPLPQDPKKPGPEYRVQRYADFEQHRRAHETRPEPSKATSTPSAPPPPKPTRSKLSFKEARELEELPARIESLESQKAATEARLADPATYKLQASPSARDLQAQLQRTEHELASAYLRWEELEARKS